MGYRFIKSATQFLQVLPVTTYLRCSFNVQNDDFAGVYFGRAIWSLSVGTIAVILVSRQRAAFLLLTVSSVGGGALRERLGLESGGSLHGG